MELFLLIVLIGISSSWATRYPNTSSYSVAITSDTHTLKRVEPIRTLERIQTVVLSNLQIRALEIVALDHLINAHLKNLDLSNNELQELPEEVFISLDELETLSLANNKFRNLGNNYFLELLSLKTLNLSNNHLTELTRKNLLGLPSSANIIMEGNTLMSLRVDGLDHSKIFPPKDYMSSYPWNIQSEERKELPRLSPFSSFKNHLAKCKTPNYPQYSITEITPELLNNLHKDVIVADLRKQSIKEIKEGVIRNGNLRKVLLDHNSLKTIEDNAFEGTGLKSLSLIHNELENMEFLGTLPTSMLELYLASNRITEICGGFGYRLKGLIRLIISNNHVKYICECAFRGLKKLREIDLSHNYIEEIHQNSFSDQVELLIIDLSNNKIRVLPPEIFKNLKKAMEIDLKNNEIKKIYRDSFLGVRNYPVFMVDLQNNQIDSIEEGSFANMTIQELLLKNNKISENSIDKGAFESCTIEDLTLNGNLFTEINGDAFYGIRVYNLISMDSNHVRKIGRDSMKHMINVPRLTLGNNPIERIEKGSFYRTQVFFKAEVKIVEAGTFENAESVVGVETENSGEFNYY